jgi:hypothetical protein
VRGNERISAEPTPSLTEGELQCRGLPALQTQFSTQAGGCLPPLGQSANWRSRSLSSENQDRTYPTSFPWNITLVILAPRHFFPRRPRRPRTAVQDRLVHMGSIFSLSSFELIAGCGIGSRPRWRTECTSGKSCDRRTPLRNRRHAGFCTFCFRSPTRPVSTCRFATSRDNGRSATSRIVVSIATEARDEQH